MAFDPAILIIGIATTYGIYLILALSFNLEYGFAGQPNLGKVFFYSIGAYVSGALTARALMALIGITDDDTLFSDIGGDMRTQYAASHAGVILGLFLASLVVATLVGAAFGYLASYPALRLRGDFLAIVLIAIGEASRVLVLTYRPIAGGVFTLTGVPNPFVWIGDPRVRTAIYAGLVLAIALGVYVFSVRLVNSPFGRLLKALRDDEEAANVLGKRAPRVKGQVLMIGSGVAGLAGALYAFYAQTVYANDFIPLVTFAAVTMVILGGVSNHKGAVVGALFMSLMDWLVRPTTVFLLGGPSDFPVDLNYVRYVVLGVVIILVLMFRPEGLIPERPVETPAMDVAREAAEPSPEAPAGAGGE